MYNDQYTDRIIQHEHDILIDKNIDAISDYYTPLSLVENEYGISSGIEEFTDSLKLLFQTFNFVDFTLNTAMHDGNTTIIAGLWKIIHIGAFAGIEPTGRKFKIQGHLIIKWKDNKINENLFYTNYQHWVKQLTDIKIKIDFGKKENQEYFILKKIQSEFKLNNYCIGDQELRCILLFYFLNLPIKLIANFFSCAPTTVKTNIRNANLKFREQIIYGRLESFVHNLNITHLVIRYCNFILATSHRRNLLMSL